MGILVRDEKIDQQVRELASSTGLTLQGAIGLAVEHELARRAERRKRIDDAFRQAQEIFGSHPVIDDGMTHKEFWDREYGDV